MKGIAFFIGQFCLRGCSVKGKLKELNAQKLKDCCVDFPQVCMPTLILSNSQLFS
ncbi:hypothetical protein PHSC3_001709 [Chlamydiales bacterium STE3]|nr:hypothetical protein PHSC3_001709 [Chlamydiales bacterium STE3]